MSFLTPGLFSSSDSLCVCMFSSYSHWVFLLLICPSISYPCKQCELLNISVNIIYYYWHMWEIFFLQSLRRSQLNNDTNTEENDQKTTWHLSRWLYESVCVSVCLMLLWGSDLSPSKVKVCFFVSSGALVSSVSFCHRAVCFAFSHLSNVITFSLPFLFPATQSTHSFSVSHAHY